MILTCIRFLGNLQNIGDAYCTTDKSSMYLVLTMLLHLISSLCASELDVILAYGVATRRFKATCCH